MKPLLVTATNTGVGKTYTTTALIKAFANRGTKALPFKPIETGVTSLPQDGVKLLASVANQQLSLDDIVGATYELAANADTVRGKNSHDWELIKAKFENLKKMSDIVLIEGAGGAFSPIEDSILNVDLAKVFDAKVLLVVHSSLGMIGDLISHLEAMKARNITPIWAVNVQDEDFETISKPYLIKHFGEVLTIQDDLDEIVDRIKA